MKGMVRKGQVLREKRNGMVWIWIWIWINDNSRESFLRCIDDDYYDIHDDEYVSKTRASFSFQILLGSILVLWTRLNLVRVPFFYLISSISFTLYLFF